LYQRYALAGQVTAEFRDRVAFPARQGAKASHACKAEHGGMSPQVADLLGFWHIDLNT
jgi:hypothetical protein